MQKLTKRTLACFSLAVILWCGTLLLDKFMLRENVIRLHVVANSDSQADQDIKIKVKDAVISSIRRDLENAADVAAAKEYLQKNLPVIEEIVSRTLRACGISYDVAVSYGQEAFATRVYDTFTLPAGIYEALRITIGEGAGRNWWCVVFPSLCTPATSEDVQIAAAGAGFPNTLQKAITSMPEYHLRFYILDVLGKVENKFFHG